MCGAKGDEVQLREETPDDEGFVERLYASIRRGEFEALGWPETALTAFLYDQHRMQRRHYWAHYQPARFSIVEQAGAPVGRLYLHLGLEEIRLIDISLIERARGAGLGGALVRSVMDEAAASGRRVSLHVDAGNPARRLYQRLGFEAVGASSGPSVHMLWAASHPS
ncbi:MAG: GNAT family N-acetyltransferase [Pseudomonadota bacterium]